MNIAIDSTNMVTIAPDSYGAVTTGSGVDLVSCYGKGQAILLAQATTGDTIGAGDALAFGLACLLGVFYP